MVMLRLRVGGFCARDDDGRLGGEQHFADEFATGKRGGVAAGEIALAVLHAETACGVARRSVFKYGEKLAELAGFQATVLVAGAE
jgi:hypothetical protein